MTVLWFGGGQDSTALLYLYYYDKNFRDKYAPDDFIVVMSDTGNEHPQTYVHVKEIEMWCKKVGIEFYFLTPEMGYHPQTWQSLKFQMERNDNIMSVALPKTCTDNLKIKPCHNFLEIYIAQKHGYDIGNKKSLIQYARAHGKINVLLGFAKGEESRFSPRTETSGTA